MPAALMVFADRYPRSLPRRKTVGTRAMPSTVMEQPLNRSPGKPVVGALWRWQEVPNRYETPAGITEVFLRRCWCAPPPSCTRRSRRRRISRTIRCYEIDFDGVAHAHHDAQSVNVENAYRIGGVTDELETGQEISFERALVAAADHPPIGLLRRRNRRRWR